MTAPHRDPEAGSLNALGDASGLWSRDARLFVAARGAAKLGDAMLPIALADALIRGGHGVGSVGLVMAAHSGCFMVFVIVGGVAADRLDALRLMVHADVVRIGTQSVTAVLFFLGGVPPWQLCLIGAVNGACAGLFQPGLASTVPRIARDVQAMNAAVKTTESAVMVLGPAVAGVLLAVTSPGVVFAVHAALFLAGAVCLTAMTPPAAHRGTTDVADFRTDLAQGWREFRERTWLWGVIALWMVLTATVMGPVTPLAAAGVVGAHGTGSYALASTALGVGMVAGGLLAWRIRPLYPLRAGAFALVGLCLQPAAVGGGLPLSAIVMAFAAAGTAMGFWNVMWATSVQTQVPPETLNRVHGFEVAGSLAMLPLGQAVAGPAAGVVGLQGVLLISAMSAIAVSTALLGVPAIRDLGRTPVRAPRHAVGSLR